MNLLITGAFSATDEQMAQLKALGYQITFVQDERLPLETDCSSFDAVVCNGLFLYNDIEKFHSLKFIQLTSAGLDRLPLDYIREHSITVKNARGVYSIPMAEWCVGQLLSVFKQTRFFDHNQKNKQWIKNRNLKDLNGTTASIIGFGSVGSETAKRLSAFGVKIIAVNRSVPKYANYDEYINIQQLDTALSESDIVILTLPLTPTTHHLFDENRWSNMKDGSILVNMSRGKIIDEQSLLTALKNGRPAFAILDVFEQEPLDTSSPLWTMENVIITPHNSFVSDKNKERLFRVIYENLRASQQ